MLKAEFWGIPATSDLPPLFIIRDERGLICADNSEPGFHPVTNSELARWVQFKTQLEVVNV